MRTPEQIEMMRKLIVALRSGKYQQGKLKLRPTDIHHCCLGVACDVFRLTTGNGRWEKERYNEQWVFIIDGDDQKTYLPDAVVDGFGFDSRNPRVRGEELAVRNDQDAPFSEIADLLERDLGETPTPDAPEAPAPI